MQIDSSIAAIVTGGASGLGEASARALAAAGAKVALFDLNAERGEAVAAEIGGVFAKVDVTDQASVDAGFATARAAHGQERVLVNCAGIVIGAKTVARDKETGAIKEYPVERFATVIEVNLIGSFRCIAKSAAGMAALEPLDQHGEKGCIVNTASVAAEDGQIGQAAYSASKGGVLAMGLPIARDLMSEGIRINTLLPGIMNTPMMAGMPDKVREALAASVPFPKRLGEGQEYADAVMFLCQNDYMNGASIRLDGAIRLAPR